VRYFYDTEFLERGPEHPISFISIGMVADDGRELYAIDWDAPLEAIRQHDWLMENVVPSLPLRLVESPGLRRTMLAWDVKHPDWPRVMPRKMIAMAVAEFLNAGEEAAELWGWYSAYDHVALAQLFGTMVDLPPCVPMWTNDLRQEAARVGNPRVPFTPDGEHNALADARWNREVAAWLKTRPS
jgi:hypothetical protein